MGRAALWSGRLAGFLLVMMVSTCTEGLVLDKCRLKAHLEAANITAEDILAKLVCTVEFISVFNTSLVTLIDHYDTGPLIRPLGPTNQQQDVVIENYYYNEVLSKRLVRTEGLTEEDLIAINSEQNTQVIGDPLVSVENGPTEILGTDNPTFLPEAAPSNNPSTQGPRIHARDLKVMSGEGSGDQSLEFSGEGSGFETEVPQMPTAPELTGSPINDSLNAHVLNIREVPVDQTITTSVYPTNVPFYTDYDFVEGSGYILDEIQVGFSGDGSGADIRNKRESSGDGQGSGEPLTGEFSGEGPIIIDTKSITEGSGSEENQDENSGEGSGDLPEATTIFSTTTPPLYPIDNFGFIDGSTDQNEIPSVIPTTMPATDNYIPTGDFGLREELTIPPKIQSTEIFIDGPGDLVYSTTEAPTKIGRIIDRIGVDYPTTQKPPETIRTQPTTDEKILIDEGYYFPSKATDEETGMGGTYQASQFWNFLYKRTQNTEVKPTESQDTIYSFLYGIFQLSDNLACKSGSKSSKNICNLDCADLIDDDITDDIACLKSLYETVLKMTFLQQCDSAVSSNYFAQCE